VRSSAAWHGLVIDETHKQNGPSRLAPSCHVWTAVLFPPVASIQRSHIRRFNASARTSLTAERIQKLNDIGFDWTVGEQRQVPWESRYRELEQFVVRE
jgi:hypothetical protein